VHIDDKISPCFTFSKVELVRARMDGKIDLREFEQKNLFLF
jgi:hypothetical protein